MDGDGADRGFDMRVHQDRIAHLTVRNGQATDGPGGGIRDTAFFNQFQYLLVTDNTAVPGSATDSGLGGGLATQDSLIQFATIAYNNAQDGGGPWYHGGQPPPDSPPLLPTQPPRDAAAIYSSAA